MRESLPQGQIVPAARPLGAYLQLQRPEIGRPAQPIAIPNAPAVRTIEQGNGGNVEGFNQWSELAQALGPFAERAISLAGAGVQMYADREYEKGQDEMIRAQILANRQGQQSAARYTAEGRRIAQLDPAAALLADKVNPFRQWGRENQATSAAGLELLPEVMRAYREYPNIQQLRPGDPEIKRLQSEAMAQVMQRYGINEDSRGFAENFLPRLGQAQQRLYEQHLDDYTKEAKEQAWRRSAAEVAALYNNARNSGVIEWEEMDQSGKFVWRSASLATDRRGWLQGISKSITRIADRLANETGIPGETSYLQNRMFEQIAATAGDIRAAELLDALNDAEQGPPGPGGVRARVGDTLGPQTSKAEYDAASIQFQRDELENKRKLNAFEDEVIPLLSLPDGPEKKQRINEMTEKFANAGVRLSDMTDSIKSLSSSVETLDLMAYDTRPIDTFLSDIQQQYGSAFNRKANYQRLLGMIKNFPADLREEYLAKFNSIAEREGSRKVSFPSGLVDPLISNKVKSNILRFYPEDASQAALRGGDILQVISGLGKANAAESVNRQTLAYRNYVYQKLEKRQGELGRELTTAEVTQTVTQALEEYGQKDKEAFGYNFPGVQQFGTPGVDGMAPRPAPAAGGQPGRPAQPPPPPLYPSGQLDNVPNRSQRLSDPNAPVLALPSVKEEIGRVVSGRAPSAQVIRAARDARMSVGRWLLRQAEGHPGLSLPEAQRRTLLRSSSGAEGVSQNIAATAAQSSPGNQLKRLGRYAFQAFVPPAAAAPATPLLVAQRQERDAVSGIARALGVAPLDVATIINFETGGSLVAGRHRGGLDVRGGDGGNYLGWIQFSPENQRKYGVRPGMSSQEMAQAVVRYFRDAGIRAGDSLEMLYQAVQAPALLKKARTLGRNLGADSNGTVSGHVQRMRSEHAPLVRRWLEGR